MTETAERDPPPVLVVGAGPAGMLMAGDLARRGVRCRLVDEERERRTAPRAVNLHARSLEVFENLGIAEAAVERGCRVSAVNFYTRGRERQSRRVARIKLGQMDSPYPFMLGIPQPETERVLEQFAVDGGVHVERLVKLVDLSQNEGGVDVELEQVVGGERERAHFDWVIGCDGAHSTVRQKLGLPFEGSDYEQVLALADLCIDGKLEDDEAHVFLSPEGSLMFEPLPGQLFRLAAELPPSAGRPEPDLGLFRELIARRGDEEAVVAGARWMSIAGFHRRRVPRYRVARVVLAGDAAHIHSPISAQGMNIGLQDAYNLAWKLALVIGGAGRDDLLDSYDAERRPVAERVLRETNLLTRALTTTNPVLRPMRDRLADVLLDRPILQRRLVRGFGEIDDRYKSPVIAEDVPSLRARRHLAGAPAPGDRVGDVIFGGPRKRRLFDVLRGTQHVLLLFAGDEDDMDRLERIRASVQASHGKFVRSHVVAAECSNRSVAVLEDTDSALKRRFRAFSASLYVIRPDGRVGYRALPPDRDLLARYLQKIFR